MVDCGGRSSRGHSLMEESRRPHGPEGLAGMWMICVDENSAIDKLYVDITGDFDSIGDAFLMDC